MNIHDQRYVAIIGDMVSSRSVNERAGVQMKLKMILDEANDTYHRAIASRFTITLGDEFQGLLKDGSPAMDIMTKIIYGMGSVQFRFGFGIGTMRTTIDPFISIGADGPAYNCARDAINAVKLSENRKKSASGTFLIRSEDGQVPFVDSVCELMSAVSSNWSPKQRLIIYDMLLSRDNQTVVAARHGIKQPTVQYSISSGHYYTYVASYDNIVKYLSEVTSLDF